MERYYCNRHSIPVGCNAGQQCSLCKTNALHHSIDSTKKFSDQDHLLKILKKQDYKNKHRKDPSWGKIDGLKKRKKFKTNLPNINVENRYDVVGDIENTKNFEVPQATKLEENQKRPEDENSKQVNSLFDTASVEWPLLEKDLYMNGFAEWVDVSEEYKDDFGESDMDKMEAKLKLFGAVCLEDELWMEVAESKENCENKQSLQSAFVGKKPMPLFADIVKRRHGQKRSVQSMFPKDPTILLNTQQIKHTKLMRDYRNQKQLKTAASVTGKGHEPHDLLYDQDECYHHLKQDWHERKKTGTGEALFQEDFKS